MKKTPAFVLTILFMISILIVTGCSNNGDFYFNASVLSVYDNSVLVRPFEGSRELKSSDQITVSLKVSSEHKIPAITEGSNIRVIYSGTILESYPAQIHEVYAIYLVDSDGNVLESEPESSESESAATVETEPVEIADLFSKPHEAPMDLVKEADLDGDGKLEKIVLTDLEHKGGDGGYQLQVFRIQNGKETSVELPNTYNSETGFPFSVKWNGELKIYAEGRCIAEFSPDEVQHIYEQKQMTEDLESAKGVKSETKGDAISGFTLINREDEASPVLAVKTYLSGLGGHGDCLGYGITELKLNPDDTWDLKNYYLMDAIAKSEYEITDSEVSMVVKKVENSEIEVEIFNHSDSEIIYGEFYELERFEDGEWCTVKTLAEDIGFADIGYEIQPEGVSIWTADYIFLYGTLPSGKYRIVKDIYLSDKEKYFMAAEFSI